jgi:hypothetical protein
MTTDYRLHVDMLVPAENSEEFEKTMVIFLNGGAFRAFDDTFDNELVFALRTKEPFWHAPERFHSTSSRPAGPASRFLSTDPTYHDDRSFRDRNSPLVHHYVHLWTVPDLEDLHLAKRMLYCSENLLYMKLDGFVLEEAQDLVRRVRWQQQPEKPDLSLTCVRAVRQLPYQSLGGYLFKLQALMPLLKRRNWHQLGQFQNITGTLNTVTEFWQTDGKSSLSDLFPTDEQSRSAKSQPPMARARQFASDVASSPVSVTRESFEYASYSPRERPSFASLRDGFMAGVRLKGASA